MYLYIYIYTYTYRYKYIIYVHMFLYSNVYLCMYTYTYTRTHKDMQKDGASPHHPGKDLCSRLSEPAWYGKLGSGMASASV